MSGSQEVVHRSVGTVRLPAGPCHDVPLTLVGGRHRYSVGGEIAEGFRWWRGRVEPGGSLPRVEPGTEIVIDLADGPTATAVVDETDPSAGEVVLFHGVGPPPFGVD